MASPWFETVSFTIAHRKQTDLYLRARIISTNYNLTNISQIKLFKPAASFNILWFDHFIAGIWWLYQARYDFQITTGGLGGVLLCVFTFMFVFHRSLQIYTWGLDINLRNKQICNSWGWGFAHLWTCAEFRVGFDKHHRPIPLTRAVSLRRTGFPHSLATFTIPHQHTLLLQPVLLNFSILYFNSFYY